MTDATSNGARMDGAGDAGTDGIPGTLSAFDRAKMCWSPQLRCSATAEPTASA